jgi:hypothetical protein
MVTLDAVGWHGPLREEEIRKEHKRPDDDIRVADRSA